MKAHRIKSALQYTLFAKHKNGYGIHSPFVFKLITEVFKAPIDKSELKQINQIRNKLIQSKNKINLRDIGASAQKNNNTLKKVSLIHKSSSVSKKYGELLYRLVKFNKPTVILETGTCFGISTSYLSKAAPHATINSIEADSNKCEIAKQNFKALKLKNIEIFPNSIDDILPDILKKVKNLDFVFLDANHTYIALKKYFELIVKHIHNESIIVLDDIHWSKEMEKGWNEIKQSKEVSLSIDLDQFGILFFRKESSKENFIIKY